MFSIATHVRSGSVHQISLDSTRRDHRRHGVIRYGTNRGVDFLEGSIPWLNMGYICTELDTHQCAAMEGLLIAESCPPQLRQLQCTSRSSVH